MKTILILGGTRFFGRALIGKLLEVEGVPPDIVCFHRGFHQADFPFPGVSHIIGDRHDGGWTGSGQSRALPFLFLQDAVSCPLSRLLRFEFFFHRHLIFI